MNILIINQHTGNRGDEAAGKALLRSICKINLVKKISVVYNTPHVDCDLFFQIDDIRVKHYVFSTRRLSLFLNRFGRIILFFFPLRLLRFWNNSLRSEIDLILDSDFIISAPSGVNIGVYRDWCYLWRIFISLRMGKKVVILSPSIGPVSGGGLFYFLSRRVLEKVDFLSVRDPQSSRYLNDFNIKHKKSIDVAFGDSTTVDIPNDLNRFLAGEYIVFVPNQLNNWHPEYLDFGDRLNSFYREIIDFFIRNDLKIVILPQVFGPESSSELDDLTSCFNKDRIFILSNIYNSDVQQEVVKRSSFLIGARYHSIVFAVKHGIPFFSLSYEHKMSAMLDELGLGNLGSDLSSLLLDKGHSEIIKKIKNIYKTKDDYLENIKDAGYLAGVIAKDNFKDLEFFLINSYGKYKD